MRIAFRDTRAEDLLTRDGCVEGDLLTADELEQAKRGVERCGFGILAASRLRMSMTESSPDERRWIFETLVPVFQAAVDRVLDDYKIIRVAIFDKLPGGDEIRPHQHPNLVDESIHRSLTIWVPLADVDVAAGTLHVVRGSHAFSNHVRSFDDFRQAYGSVSKRLLRRHGRPALLRAGQAIAFDDRLIHWSPRNTSSRIRSAVQLELIPREAQPTIFFRTSPQELGKYPISDETYRTASFTRDAPPALEPIETVRQPSLSFRNDQFLSFLRAGATAPARAGAGSTASSAVRAAATIMNGPVISVIVPFRNAAPYARACIGSLRRQDYPRDRVEILPVENGSTDGSTRIIEEEEGIRCLHSSEIGAYPARNHGIRHASGDILAFTDVDCIPSPDWLRRMELAFRDPGIGLVLGSTTFGGPSRLLRRLESYENAKAEWVCGRNGRARYFGYANNMGIRRSWMNEVGFFEPLARGSDTILVQRLIAIGGTDLVRYDATVRVEHVEIASIAAWAGKRFVYGRSSHVYGKVVPSQPLTLGERREIVRALWLREPGDVGARVATYAALGLGLCSFLSGRLVARFLARPIRRAPARRELGT